VNEEHINLWLQTGYMHAIIKMAVIMHDQYNARKNEEPYERTTFFRFVLAFLIFLNKGFSVQNIISYHENIYQ
jgi:hypothetical protein